MLKCRVLGDCILNAHLNQACAVQACECSLPHLFWQRAAGLVEEAQFLI